MKNYHSIRTEIGPISQWIDEHLLECWNLFKYVVELQYIVRIFSLIPRRDNDYSRIKEINIEQTQKIGLWVSAKVS